MTPEQAREAFKKRHFVRSSDDFPKGDHLAIIEFGAIHIPGDERSKQCPGHGYGEHDEPTMTYIWWEVMDREYWEAEIVKLENSYKRNTYVALDCGKLVTFEPIYQIKIAPSENKDANK